tara:strand:+ start:893 stop:1198 length:306 start_codon:yes stop_codon:yes gene_type:complete
MTKQQLIELLQAGKVDEFNQFRADNPDFIPDLIGVALLGANLIGVDLHGVDLRGAVLHGVDFRGANLKGADLTGADLLGAIFDNQQIAMLPELLQIVVIED